MSISHTVDGSDHSNDRPSARNITYDSPPVPHSPSKSHEEKRSKFRILPIRPATSDGVQPKRSKPSRPQMPKFFSTSGNGKSDHHHLEVHPDPIIEHPDQPPSLLMDGTQYSPDRSDPKPRWYKRWKPTSNPASPTSPIVSPPPDIDVLEPESNIFYQSPSPLPQPDLGEDQGAILQQAIDDPMPFIHETPDGYISAGNLVGLVERLVDFPGKSFSLTSGDISIMSHADARRSAEYRDIFLSTFVAWTNSQTVYRLLVQKYGEAEKLPIGVQARIRFK